MTATFVGMPVFPEAAREALGWDVHLLHDIHHRLTPIEAARLGRDLEPYRLFWMEDATPADHPEAFRLIRQHTTTPIAVGEVFNSIWDCKALIEQQLIDVILPCLPLADIAPELDELLDGTAREMTVQRVVAGDTPVPISTASAAMRVPFSRTTSRTVSSPSNADTCCFRWKTTPWSS